jgi:hypothetical protein
MQWSVSSTAAGLKLGSSMHACRNANDMQDATDIMLLWRSLCQTCLHVVQLQEYFLHALSQPRPHASLDLIRQQYKDELGSSMRRSQSYRGLDPLGIPSAVYGAMHDIHASFLHVAQGVKSKKQGVPSFGALPQSKRASFRTSDGGVAGGLGLCPGGLSPTGAAAAHPVISMLAEQVSKHNQSVHMQCWGSDIITMLHPSCDASSFLHAAKSALEQTEPVVQKLPARKGLSLTHTPLVAQSHCAVFAHQITCVIPNGGQ